MYNITYHPWQLCIHTLSVSLTSWPLWGGKFHFIQLKGHPNSWQVTKVPNIQSQSQSSGNWKKFFFLFALLYIQHTWMSALERRIFTRGMFCTYIFKWKLKYQSQRLIKPNSKICLVTIVPFHNIWLNWRKKKKKQV